jgi:hypothetical protein
MASGVGTARHYSLREMGLPGDRRKVSLETLADKEISRHGHGLGSIRLFSETRLQHKARREAGRFREVLVDDIPDEVVEHLFEQWIARQLSQCKLTRFQRAVYEMNLRGLSVAEIAGQVGQSRQRISAILSDTRHTVRNRPRDKYDGLEQVYWQEVRRYVYRKPRHPWNG